MGRPDSDLELLRTALAKLAEADAEELLADARERARVRAAQLIEDALVDELLQAAALVRSASPRAAHETTRAEAHRTTRAELRSTTRAQTNRSASESLWWAYCVVPARAIASLPDELEGIEPGTTVQVVHEGELAALVSPVPAEEYDDVRLREHLEDLSWLELTARMHEAVLEAVLDRVSLVPLRLCTLYRDLEGIRRLLGEQAEALAGSLSRVDGCAEWGVKVFAGVTATEAAGAQDESEDPAIGGPGSTYLVHRRRERERAERVSALRAQCAEDVHQRVCACARAAGTNPPQSRELHGRDMTMVLNGVYLVESERTGELSELIGALKDEWEPAGFVLELTGPWPAYNFVSDAIGVVP